MIYIYIYTVYDIIYIYVVWGLYTIKDGIINSVFYTLDMVIILPRRMNIRRMIFMTTT